jgi:hypothetical protein
VVDVADSADVDVRLGPLEFTFCHFILPSKRTMLLNDVLI